MLVLTRNANQSIVLDGGIKITILSVDGQRVKVGVTAPDTVRVLREELTQQKLVSRFTGSR